MKYSTKSGLLKKKRHLILSFNKKLLVDSSMVGSVAKGCLLGTSSLFSFSFFFHCSKIQITEFTIFTIFKYTV